MTYDASVKTHTENRERTHLAVDTRAFIDLVIMLLFKYFGASLLGTSAVVLTLIPQKKVEEEQNVNEECRVSLPICILKFQHERLDMGKPCQGYTDKVLQCAGAACNSSEDKAFVSTKIETKICAICQNTGFCTFSKLLAGMKAQEEAFDREQSRVAELQNIGKSSSSGATLSASAVVVLLSALKTAWAVCV